MIDKRFLSENHVLLFQELMSRFFGEDEIGHDMLTNHRDLGPSLYALAAITYKADDLRRHIGRHHIDFPGLLKTGEAWSDGERSLLRLAANLWNDGDHPATVGDCFGGLDARNFEAATYALRWRFGRLDPA